MSRIVSGQLRLLEQSSKIQAMHEGIFGNPGDNIGAPKSEEQDHPNLKRDASQRGKKVIVGIVEGSEDLLKNSTYVEPFSHFSVGFDLSKEDAKDLNKSRKLMRKGKRNIIHPNRKGKEDKSGMSLPSKKQNDPPKTSSSLVSKKKTHKRKQTEDKIIQKKEEHKNSGIN